MRGGVCMVLASLLVAFSSASRTSVGSSDCMKSMHDGVKSAGFHKKWMEFINSKPHPENVDTTFDTTIGNCVNNTDFWNQNVMNHADKPMQGAESKKYLDSGRCNPVTVNVDDRANDHITTTDRDGHSTLNPAYRWRDAVNRADHVRSGIIYRVALIHQHERDRKVATTEKRHCRGAHAVTFYAKGNKMYQLPSAWVNMYTVVDWVQANPEPWSMDSADFFTELAKLFDDVQTCEVKWVAFKKLFLPGGSFTKYNDWQIPPVFAKHKDVQITKESTCDRAEDKKHWYTEPNAKFKSPYWRELVWHAMDVNDASCAKTVRSFFSLQGGSQQVDHPAQSRRTSQKNSSLDCVGNRLVARGERSRRSSVPPAYFEEAELIEEDEETEVLQGASTPNHHHGHRHHHHHHHHHRYAGQPCQNEETSAEHAEQPLGRHRRHHKKHLRQSDESDG